MRVGNTAAAVISALFPCNSVLFSEKNINKGDAAYMSRYIIDEANGEKSCYYKGNDGIYKKTFSGSGWSDGRRIYKNAIKDFCVKTDANNILHILCIDNKGDIVYIKNGGNEHILIKSNNKIFAKKLRMYESNHRISLVYTAEYGDELLLIYCILGVNAIPVTVDTVKNDDFYLYDEKVYYQNMEGVLGYKDFADGRPDNFEAVAEDASEMYIAEINQERYEVYRNKEGIIFCGNKIIDDKCAEYPIICEREGRIMVVWESGGFMRYMVSNDGGESFNSPMRFLNNVSMMKRYIIQSGENYIYEYASERGRDIRFFADSGNDVKNNGVRARRNNNIQGSGAHERDKIMIMIQMMKGDIQELKERVEALERFFEGRESGGEI